jgi:hypothetical protein
MPHTQWSESAPHPTLLVVIRSQKEIADATTEVLLNTIVALTGTRPTPDASRAVIERRAAHAIMLAEEERNHRGVPKGAPPPDISFPGLVKQLCACTAAPHTAGAPALRATGTGTSRVQAHSARAAVLAWITAQPHATATQAQVDAQFGVPCRGHTQKLLSTLHLERVTL